MPLKFISYSKARFREEEMLPSLLHCKLVPRAGRGGGESPVEVLGKSWGSPGEVLGKSQSQSEYFGTVLVFRLRN